MGRCFSGTTSVSGLDGDRLTGAVVCCTPLASVTEMIAKRGSTASSKVSSIDGGGVSSTAPGVGTVFTR